MNSVEQQELEICRKNLKKYRNACKFTQEQVANALGIERSTYTYYETGKSKPNAETLIKLAKIFGIKVDKFFDPSFSPESSPIQYFEQPNPFLENAGSRIVRESVPHLNSAEKQLLTLFRALSTNGQMDLMKKAEQLKEKELNLDE